jgi:hypothetical protein
MKKDKHITEVIFRKYKPSHNFGVEGEILAIFPYSICNINGNVDCYQHIGQHGEANYHHCINTLTVPATEEESKELKKELENGFGYNFKVLKKRNSNKFSKEFQKFREDYFKR